MRKTKTKGYLGILTFSWILLSGFYSQCQTPYIIKIQKQVLYKLTNQVYTDSVLAAYTVSLNYRTRLSDLQDSTIRQLHEMNKISRGQISLLLLSQNKDIELISIKNKQLNRQKRLKWLGFGLAGLFSLFALSR